MKKTIKILIIILLFILLALFACSKEKVFFDKESPKTKSIPNALNILEENTFYFEYKNKPMVMITYASSYGRNQIYEWVGDKNPNTRDSVLDEMKNYKLNHIYHIMDLRLGQPNCPFKKELNQGIEWEPSYWNSLKELVDYANKLDIIVEIIVTSQSTLEVKQGGWESHLWNEKNGGIIAEENNFGFFELEGGTWQEKNKYYQEELFKKVIKEFENYPNIVLGTMWEIDDVPDNKVDLAFQWLNETSKYLKQKDYHLLSVIPTKCYGIRSKFCSLDSIDYIMLQNKGSNTFFLKYDKPVVLGGPWAKKLINETEFIKYSTLKGMHPSTNMYHNELNVTEGFYYSKELAPFLESIQTWNDEPGNEINETNIP